jgi:hypothetical protein
LRLVPFSTQLAIELQCLAKHAKAFVDVLGMEIDDAY